MGLYAKIDKQTGKYYEVVSTKESISKQNFYLIFLVLLFFSMYL